MYFNKIHHPANFTFATAVHEGYLKSAIGDLPLSIIDHGDNVFHLSCDDKRWPISPGQNELTPPTAGNGSDFTLAINENAGFVLQRTNGEAIVTGRDAASIGIAGTCWMLQLDYQSTMNFYGMGEKYGQLEKTGTRTKFWNTDVWADFAWSQIVEAQADPLYVSIPYVIIHTENHWVGILIDSPYASFMCTGDDIDRIADQQGIASEPRLYLGADNGAPSIWVIAATSLAELTERYQNLVGKTPLPPMWALGHQQCRFGYASADDLAAINTAMTSHGIPNSGIWLDIDYMDGYRVFTWSPEYWPQETKLLSDQIHELQTHGQIVVPILDPGVKREEAFDIFANGQAADIWCKNEDGLPFTGYVWPGQTQFPDFLSEKGRTWWQDQVANFASVGIYGVWCDMNDPAVGPVELEPMRFIDGTWNHDTGHNQYGAQMARATHAGLLQAHPEKRPFILSRSGYTGCQQHTALWTGDNCSNWRHLRSSLATSMNLALSGVPFNGPDIPGFGEDASEELALRWYQAGFLGPFLRNHSMKGTRAQEPYTFAHDVRDAIAHLIRLRYRFLPYLYQLWIAHAATGSAIMRPVFYDTKNEKINSAYATADDLFMIGPDLLQAPILEQHCSQRTINLPAGEWFDLCHGGWVSGDQTILWQGAQNETPLYVRAGAVLPLLRENPRDHRIDTAAIDLHTFLKPHQHCDVCYQADDGESFAYEDGQRSIWRGTLSLNSNNEIEVTRLQSETGWKPLDLRVIRYDQTADEVPLRWRATGNELSAWIDQTIST